MLNRGHLFTLLAGGLVLTVSGAIAQDMMFGGEEDSAYANSLWQAMEDAKLAGEGAIHALPYPGTDPHGAFLETLNAAIDVEGDSGTVIVKRNYMPAEGGAAAIWDDPAAHLGAITVMFQRAGYDPDNGDWFWARYNADGSLATTDDGTAMAGKVNGCISCHMGAEGGDYVFVND